MVTSIYVTDVLVFYGLPPISQNTLKITIDSPRTVTLQCSDIFFPLLHNVPKRKKMFTHTYPFYLSPDLIVSLYFIFQSETIFNQTANLAHNTS